MRWFFVAVAALLATGAWAQDIGGGRLTVTGVGQIDSQPDMATITMGTTAEARTAAQALDRTSVATAAMLALLTEAGVAPRDMQTSNLSLSPLWDNSRSSTPNDPPGIVGYQASNTVTVRVRKLAGLGAILDAVVEGGANSFRGLSFGLQNPAPVQDAARRAAVAEAMRKAALYAKAAGLTLGPVLELTESGGAVPRPAEMARMALSEAVPVAQGEVSVRAQVSMTFAIGGP